MVGRQARKPPRPDPGRIGRALWGTVPAAAATAIGALAVMALGAVGGLIVALAAVVLLVLTLPRLQPSDAVIRVVLLLTGPPLRYALVVVAVWYAWVVRGEGPFLALVAGLALVLVVPVASVGLGTLLYGRRGKRS